MTKLFIFLIFLVMEMVAYSAVRLAKDADKKIEQMNIRQKE